jgi:hypothetical protein
MINQSEPLDSPAWSFGYVRDGEPIEPKAGGLPFDKLRALRSIQGLEVHPEPRLSTPPSKAGLRAAERVNPMNHLV